MPELNLPEWTFSTLRDNAQLITDGAHASPPTRSWGRPIATVQNMGSQSIDVGSCRLISGEDFEKLVKGNCAPEIDDVLFSKDGTVGKTFVYRQSDRVVLLSSIAIIRLKKDKLNPEFCSQFLLSPFFYQELENLKSGSAIRRIVLGELEKLRIPTPPLPEQRKIAAVLSCVDDVIEKTRAQIDKLKDLKTGMMQELLTEGIGHTEFKDSPVGRIPSEWDVLTVSELLAHRQYPMRSGPFGSSLLKAELVSKGVPLLGIDNVHVEEFKSDFKRFVTSEKSRELARFLVKPGDVMVTIMGTVGRCCVVPNGIGRALSSKHVWTISLDTDQYLPELLCWQVNHAPWVLRQFRNDAQGGVMASISSSTLRNLKVPVPPREEQEKIARFYSGVISRINSASQKLEKLQFLKKALMADLLAGKVRVNVDQKESEVA